MSDLQILLQTPDVVWGQSKAQGGDREPKKTNFRRDAADHGLLL